METTSARGTRVGGGPTRHEVTWGSGITASLVARGTPCATSCRLFHPSQGGSIPYRRSEKKPSCVLCGNLRANKTVSCIFPASLLNSRFEGQRPSASSRHPCFPSLRIPVGISRAPPPLRGAHASRGLGSLT